ncbi:hypothetical protein vseg_006404 [Gypsophila vaccaria]
MENQEQVGVGVVMVPFPAQSHLNQLLQLSHLIASHGLQVHYAGSTVHNRQVKHRNQNLEREGRVTSARFVKVKFHDFDLGPYSTPSPNPNASSNTPSHLQPLRLATVRLRQPIFGLLKELAAKYRRIIVIHDTLMSSVVQDVKNIPNAEVYIFHVTSAFALFYGIWQSMAKKPFQLDGVPRHIPCNEGYNTTSDFTNFIVSQIRLSLQLASGSINNTCRLIEDKFIGLYQKLPMNSKIRHFPLGPFNRIEKINVVAEECKSRHRCLQWLDEQEFQSVIYVSFGTLTSLTDNQIAEIAVGLEKSGQKFIWVLRVADKGDIFTEDDADDQTRRPQLPDNYEERVKDQGLVVKEWAPQFDILAHPSTGGFMSHCGWSSCVESISMGVAIAAWPITSDQPKNAVLVTEVLGVGVLVRDWEPQSKVVESTTVENAVRKLMQTEEGEKIRKRTAQLGCDVRASCAKGGSSRLEMDSFISHITR